MRSVRWIAAASLLTGVWIGARNSALLGASRGGGEGTTCSVPARYSAYDGLEATLEAWAEAAPGEVFVRELATSRGGRSLRCLEIAPAPDGPRETDEKQWTVLLVGGLDGRSIASSLAVLRAGALLTERLPTLRRDVRVLLVPAASPDALADARAAKSGRPEGRNRRPFDDDGDGAFAEDPPDDLDGDGLVLDMLLEDPLGPWQLEGTPPRLLPAGERSAVRYTLVREGRDDDGDGRFNEDAEGGVRYDQHFPTGWAGGPGSARPLSEPVARALADLAVEEEVDLALVFGGEHGGLRFVQPR
ncbi:MAG: M14 family zinc carboxypeptidase, partial [Planctomycetota bacterium]